MTTPMTPERIQTIRELLGLTQEQAAYQIGTSQVTWSRWERGHTHPIPVFRECLRTMERKAFGEEGVK